MLIEEFKINQTDKIKPSTLERYTREIDAFTIVYPADKVGYSELIEYFEELAKDYKPQYLQVAKSSLQRYFNFLITEGLRQDNPVKNIELKKSNKEVKHHELLTTEELDVILEDRKERYQALKWRNKLLLSFVRYQGLTNSDLLQLSIDDIKNGQLQIDAHSGLNGYIFKLEPIQVEFFYEWKAIRTSIMQKGVTIKT